VLRACWNDLEPAAESVEPRLSDFRRDLEEAARAPALLAGSGSAYAVLPEDDRRANDIARRIRRKLKVPVVASRTATRGVRVGLG